MKIAVVGGGINGLCTAWFLSSQGHRITLYERDKIMQATSKASSKLLHGGLRYLENYEFKLVREASKERLFWIKNAPQLAHKIRIFLPVYTNSRRSSWLIKAGLFIYDIIAGNQSLGKHKKENLEEFIKNNPTLKKNQLKAVYSYSDGQMYDEELGVWVGAQARKEGAKILENHKVISLKTNGVLEYLIKKGSVKNDKSMTYHKRYDQIYNITGPWSEQLLRENGIKNTNSLNLIRGSHIIFNEQINKAYFLEIPNENRIFFVLPYKGKTMVGTTEVKHSLNKSINASVEEKKYLLNAYNHYFTPEKTFNQIKGSFAGIRPLVNCGADYNKASRECVLEKHGKIITVFGGKWTTAHSLARKLAQKYT